MAERTVFDAVSLSASVVYSAAIQLSGEVVLIGDLTLAGGATIATFGVESSKDGLTGWRSQGILGAATEADSVVTAPLVPHKFTSNAAVMPIFSFVPDLKYFRISALVDAGSTSAITMSVKEK